MTEWLAGVKKIAKIIATVRPNACNSHLQAPAHWHVQCKIAHNTASTASSREKISLTACQEKNYQPTITGFELLDSYLYIYLIKTVDSSIETSARSVAWTRKIQTRYINYHLATAIMASKIKGVTPNQSDCLLLGIAIIFPFYRLRLLTFIFCWFLYYYSSRVDIHEMGA